LCWHDRLAPQIALKIKITDFSTQTYRTIAAAALDFLERHNRPARAHIGDILEDEIRRGPEGRFMTEILREMERLGPELQEAYVLGELDRFLATQRLINTVNRASDLLHAGSLEEARETLATPDVVTLDKPGVFLRDTERWLAFLRDDEEDHDRFACGIDTLDERGVRPARGEFFALLGCSGTGKSWFLINAGKHNAIDEHKNVLHITLENSLDVTLGRYTQCLLSLTRDQTKTVEVRLFDRGDGGSEARLRRRPDNPTAESLGSLGYHELAHRLAPFQRRGQLLVKHFPTGTLSLGMLVAYLDSLDKLHEFKPDIVLLDYLALMNIDTRDLRVAMGKLARDLRGLAEIRRFAFMTVVQAHRRALTAGLVTAGAVAEDWSIVHTADTFLTYSQTPHEHKQGIARILVDKARNAQDKWIAFITQSYDRGQFHLDSEYFNATLKEQLENEIAAEEGPR
jgi:hypothetical protein